MTKARIQTPCVMPSAFPLQQYLGENASLLRHTYVASLVYSACNYSLLNVLNVTIVQYGMREYVTSVKKQLIKKEVVDDFLDIVNRYNLKSYSVTKGRSALVFRWRRERETSVGSLEITSPNF
jgi:hypothetical protein